MTSSIHHSTITGVPSGFDAFVLSELLEKAGVLVYVVRDDRYGEEIAKALPFFAPHAEVLFFPPWDCLPYDRASPHVDLMGRRLEVLAKLASPATRKRIVIVPVAALLQRVPPLTPGAAGLHIHKGSMVSIAQLSLSFEALGYVRTQTVREWGEYAIRGGIVDVFPSHMAKPVRLDFFGDEVESLRAFDAFTQISDAAIESISFNPAHEVSLTPVTIERFRSGYRDLAGIALKTDPLYEAVSEGRRHPGLEHWLPLFFESCPTVADYLKEARWFFDPLAIDAAAQRQAQIHDHYDTRVAFNKMERTNKQQVYHPLPPASLYVMEEEWEALCTSVKPVQLSPFSSDAKDAVDAGGRRGRDFTSDRSRSDVNLFDVVLGHVRTLQRAKIKVLVTATTPGSLARIKTLLEEHGGSGFETTRDFAHFLSLECNVIGLGVQGIEQGVQAPGWCIITAQDILGERLMRGVKKKASKVILEELSSLEVGDYVVHAEHGIARYEGLETVAVLNIPHDCLRLMYEGGDKLFVPVESMNLVSRYGASESGVALDRLGSQAWQSRKARVKERLKSIAEHLMKIAAARALRTAPQLIPVAGGYDEFCARFPYDETDDQLRAIDEVLGDLELGKPMDRLVCGDVGFGKTEVALRAAYTAASNGEQVALVVPTTLLARQHFANFQTRFAGTAIKVAQLSRFVSPKDAKVIKEELASGGIHIIISTHGILADSVKFNNLGLLIVDEEQHFGVKQKEKLKALKADVHVLTLTATPIPRTLQMALSGVRELSLITTPPVDRMSVRTFITPFDGVVLREALLREHYRGGQSFYVCPRIEDLPKIEERLKMYVPEVKYAIAHGGISAGTLDEIMTDFCDGKFDVLIATNIIESGIDIPTANTLIVHRADRFGLAQLYQLRGRVGRSKIRGYAYFTLPGAQPITENARKRLEVLQSLEALGSGFSLASHDLEIRGAGNLLGDAQSGHIKEVGVELYQHMLEQAIEELKSGGTMDGGADTWSPQLSLGVAVLIPGTFVADLGVRLGLYKRLSAMNGQDEVELFAAELIDRFGPLPDETQNLLTIVSLKLMCKVLGIEKWDAGPKGVVVTLRQGHTIDIASLMQFIQEEKGAAKIRPDWKIVFMRDWGSPKARMKGSAALLRALTGKLKA